MSKQPEKIFGIIGNPEKEKVWDLLPKLLSWFREHGQQLYLSEGLADGVSEDGAHITVLENEKLAREVDLLLALGGDGTILHIARLVGDAGTPILGIRLGGLGFLAEVYLDEIYDRLHRLIDGKYDIEKRMTIAAEVKTGGQRSRYIALNDFVVNKARPLRMLNIRVSVNGDYLNTYSADGLIVCSPTGSTAYSLSVMGPIVVPTLDAMVINPISPHSLTARPVVLPGNSRITIEFEEDQDELIMSADGQTEVDITRHTVIDITRGDYTINLVVWEERNFFDVLRRKMQWGRDPRNDG
ncbi:MAG: NAD(+)/NADH kinase [Candidatus Marinimicrobia bacterium]|nr:NAD(+)/NADH kinase [Candidatus Neomarinimicrobiota bacterium]MCF7830349.1 NAD(+)/NADH kinase [Candidatus Neomarinimicrobiota bacterium]MCF7882445.1 NAD(+)/NADH kinase [Candidatus Neomarinimicrobiota bacterium]